MIDTNEITRVYNSLFSTMVAKYDDMWTANEIDAETYAKLVGQASSQLVSLASELVQKQEQLDYSNQKMIEEIDIAKKQSTKVDEEIALLTEQTKLAYTERVLKDKQAAKLGLDDAIKIAEGARNGTTVYAPNYE